MSHETNRQTAMVPAEGRGRKRKPPRPAELVWIETDVMRDIRFIVAPTPEGLGECVSRLLRPVARDAKLELCRRELDADADAP